MKDFKLNGDMIKSIFLIFFFFKAHSSRVLKGSRDKVRLLLSIRKEIWVFKLEGIEL